MPKGKAGHRGPRKPRGATERITVVPFRFALQQSANTVVTTYVERDLTTANLGSRVADMAWDWEYFRLVSLHAKSVLSTVETTTAIHGLYYDEANAATVVTPASLMQANSFLHSDTGGPFQMPRLSLSRRELLQNRSQRWFHTQTTGSPDATELSAGTLGYWLQNPVAQTNIQTIVVWGVVEFQQAADPALTAQRRRDPMLCVPASIRSDPVIQAQASRLRKLVEQAVLDEKESCDGQAGASGHVPTKLTPA